MYTEGQQFSFYLESNIHRKHGNFSRKVEIDYLNNYFLTMEVHPGLEIPRNK
jgi:hypothetical protein